MSKYKHIDDFIKIPQLNNNDLLFHYTSAAGIKGITGGEFWVTESRFLNDSTEFTIGTDICMEILEKHMRNPRRLLYAKDLLMEQGYDKTMGARPLRRVIESEIRDNVTDFYLDHIDAKHLLADVKDGHIVISEKADSDDSKDQDKAEK